MQVFLLVPWEVTCKKIKDKINGLLAGTHTGTCPLYPLLGVATPACLLCQHHLSYSGDQKRRKQKGSLVKRRRCEKTFQTIDFVHLLWGALLGIGAGVLTSKLCQVCRHFWLWVLNFVRVQGKILVLLLLCGVIQCICSPGQIMALWSLAQL